MEELERDLPRNWIPEWQHQEKMTELFKNPFMKKKDDFLKSPAEAPAHRKVLLEDKDISQQTQKHSRGYASATMTSYPKTAVTLEKQC